MTGETILLFQESQGIFLRDLEETVISVLSDIEANFSANDVELWHRLGKPDRNK